MSEYMSTEQRAQLAAVAAELSALTGDVYALAKGEDRWPQITRADGAGFWLSGSREGRWTVHAIWPKGHDGREQTPYFSQYSENGPSSPSIGVSQGKPAKQIAGDVVRRYLPGYLPIWARMVERATGAKRAADATAANMRQLAAAVGGTLAPVNGQPEARIKLPAGLEYRSRGGYVSELSVSADTVSFSLRGLPVETAAAILQLLQASGPPAGQDEGDESEAGQ